MVQLYDGGGPSSTFEEDVEGYGGTFDPITRTVLDVIQAVKRQFGDESGVQIEEGDIIRWVNDAQDVIVARNKVIKARATLRTIGGEADYRFPTEDVHQVESLHVNGAYIPHVDFSTAERRILVEDPSRVSTGDPALWSDWGGRFILWPTPDKDSRIDLYFTKRPRKITSSEELLGVPDKYYQDVVRFVLQNAYEMDEDYKASQMKREQFDESLLSMGEEERAGQHMSYHVIPAPLDF